MQQYSVGSVEGRGFPVTFKASAAETTTSTHAQFDTGFEGGSLLVKVAITASSGTTPTLLVNVQGSVDGSTWITLGTVGAGNYVVGTGTAASNFTTTATSTGVFPRLKYVRTTSSVGGTTPSFTYSVTGVVC